MRKLVMLRGVPSSGKSTFVERFNLQAYTISLDTLRMLHNGTNLQENGLLGIAESPSYEQKEFYENYYILIEKRMARGDFLVLDSTNLNPYAFATLKKLVKAHRYQAFSIDLTAGLTVNDLLLRDAKRPEYKQVGEECINRMYKAYEQLELPNWLEDVTVEQFEEKVLSTETLLTDVSKYERVQIFGDIHGCYSALTDALGEMDEQTLYVFSGDYLERGIENVETMELLIQLATRPNTIFLEGNHERYIWQYANNQPITSHRFRKDLVNLFDKSAITKEQLRIFYRSLRKLLYFKLGEQKVLVTHGGLPCIPTYLPLVPETQIINGVGTYETDIDRLFNENTTTPNVYQVHGHRNLFSHSTIVGNSINLEGNVECGGALRSVIFDGENVEAMFTKNPVFDESLALHTLSNDTELPTFIKFLENSPYIKKTQLEGNLHAFNFSSIAFYDGIWDDLTVRARGLHIDTKNNDIVARGFDKFFNDDEYDLSSLFSEGAEE